MRNTATFDPLFGDAPSGDQDRRTPERRAFLFDGWSYRPLLAAQADRDEHVRVLAGRED